MKHACIALLLLAGCSSQGTITGELSEPQGTGGADSSSPPAVKYEQVAFEWHSDGEIPRGSMSTTLPDGENFTGSYREIVDGAMMEDPDGFYSDWYGEPWDQPYWRWGDTWQYYEPGVFVTEYTGHVVAILKGDRGTHMRCDFHLHDGEQGMSSGGAGECQLSNGDRITSTFAPESGA